MRVLEPGNFFALGRAITKERLLVHVGNVETSHEIEDSKYGSEAPPTPDKIKELLPKLADLPKQAEEKAKTEAELRYEIRSLKAQLRTQPTATKEVKVVDREAIQRAVNQTTVQFNNQFARLRNTLASIAETAAKAANAEAPKITKLQPTEVHQVSVAFVNKRGDIVTPPRPSVQKPSDEARNSKLRSGAERMLAALATWHPNGMTEGQMRAHAGLKKSGTFSAYMSDLRKGYIEERDGLVFATQEGLDYCEHIPAAPQSTEEVLAIWNPKLRDGACRMLDVLVQKAGEPISKEELGDLARLQKSGTFSAYLSDLKTARLVTVNRDGTVAANKETLFL